MRFSSITTGEENQALVDPRSLTIGIQGGAGSFNDEALQHYMRQQGVATYETVYLHTTARVLKALQKGRVARGQIAIHSTLGGLVEESVMLLGRYRFEVIDWYTRPTRHCLIGRPEVDLASVKTLMTHPQVLKECQQNLTRRYSHLEQTVAVGEQIDPAAVAQALSAGRLPASIATLSSRALAEVYGLRILDTDLQDRPDNATTFLFVRSER